MEKTTLRLRVVFLHVIKNSVRMGKSTAQSTVRLLEMRYTILRNLNLQFLY